MGRKAATKPQPEHVFTPEPVISGGAPPADGELPDVLNWIQQQLPGGGEAELNIRVYQLLGSNTRGGGTQPFLYEINPDDLANLERDLADQYPAGGRFRVMVRHGGRVVKGAVMEIAPRPNYRAPPRFAQPQPFEQQQQQVTLPPASPLESAMAQFLKFQMEESARNREFQNAMLTALRDRPAQAAVDPQAIIANTMGMFKSFQEAMPKAAGENIMDVLTKGIEFGKMIAGNAEPAAAKGLAGMVESLVSSDLGKSLAQVVMQGANHAAAPPQQHQLTHQAPAGPARVIPRYAPAPRQAPPVEVAPAVDGQTMNNAMQFLFGQAQAGADPGLLAEQVGPMIPEHVWNALEASENPVEYLASMYPKVNHFRPWFDRLADNLLEDAPAGDDTATIPDANVEQHSTV